MKNLKQWNNLGFRIHKYYVNIKHGFVDSLEKWVYNDIKGV